MSNSPFQQKIIDKLGLIPTHDQSELFLELESFLRKRDSKELFVFLLLIIVDDEASEKISFVLKSLSLITFEYVSEVNNKTFLEIFVEIKPFASDKR